MKHYDIAIIGSGPGGEHLAWRLMGQKLKVALIEKELIGGECTNWACIPSKTLLRPPEIRAEGKRGFGVTEPRTRWNEVARYRDYMVRNHDDSGAAADYRKRGIDVIKGQAEIVGPDQVAVDGSVLRARNIVVATGSRTKIPSIPGLREAGYWTNREATALSRIPKSVAVIGAGAVGVELGQMLARYGARVDIIQHGQHVLSREEPEVSDRLATAFADEGITVHLRRRVRKVQRRAGSRIVELDNGTRLTVERILVATGREPNTAGLGLKRVGAKVTERGIRIDRQCRVTGNVWAVGDVTGVSLFTHLAKYQARVVAANLLGKRVRADYRAIPRVVFTDPEVAAVGLTETESREKGLDVVVGSYDLASVSRTYIHGEGLSGSVSIMIDRKTKRVLGAWAIGPLASEWIHQLVLAVQAKLSAGMLADTIQQFPSFSEAIFSAAEDALARAK